MKSFGFGDVVRSPSPKVGFSSPDEFERGMKTEWTKKDECIVLLSEPYIGQYESVGGYDDYIAWLAFTSQGCVWVRTIFSYKDPNEDGFFERV